MQTVLSRSSPTLVLYLFLALGLAIGIMHYIIDYVLQSHDSIMLFVNFPVQGILPAIFEVTSSALPYPLYWFLVIPVSVAVWGAMGFIAYLIGRLIHSS